MELSRNVGGVDRVIRIVAGILLLLLVPFAFAGILPPRAWLGLLGIPLALTGVFGFCLTYRLLGIGTARDRRAAAGDPGRSRAE